VTLTVLLAALTAFALLWLGGRPSSARVPFGQVALGVTTGLVSIGVGCAFILERSAALPSLLGG
jgi:hypothetical protein